MQYNQPYGGAANAPFVNGDPSIGLAGSIPPAAAIEYPQREIVNLITNTGGTGSNGDLHQLSKGVQSGQLNYKTDTGTANAYAVLLTPSPGSYFAGLFIIMKAITENTSASVLNVNSLGNKPIVHRDGSGLSAGEIKVGGIYAFYYDGTNFQFVWSTAVAGAGTVFLTAARTFFVNATTGHDVNFDGTSATVIGSKGPFATLARAALEVVKYNLNGFDITVNVADGTYTTVSMKAVSGSGNVNWVGNATTPANVNVTAALADQYVISVFGNTHTVNGFKVSNSLGGGVGISSNGVLTVSNMEYGACKGPHNSCTYGSTLRFAGTIMRITGSITSGGALPATWLWAYQGATVEMTNIGSPPALTLVGTPDIPAGFITAQMLSTATILFSSITGTGTGVRYKIDTNSVSSGSGGVTTYYPGNAAGSVLTGGQYV